MTEVFWDLTHFSEIFDDINRVFAEMAVVGTTTYVTDVGLHSLEKFIEWYDQNPGSRLIPSLAESELGRKYQEISQKIASVLGSPRTDDKQFDFITRINTIPVQTGDSLSGTKVERFVVCDMGNFYKRRAYYLLSKSVSGTLSDFLPYSTFLERLSQSSQISTPASLMQALISPDTTRFIHWDSTCDKTEQAWVLEAIKCIQSTQNASQREG